MTNENFEKAVNLLFDLYFDLTHQSKKKKKKIRNTYKKKEQLIRYSKQEIISEEEWSKLKEFEWLKNGQINRFDLLRVDCQKMDQLKSVHQEKIICGSV